MSEVPLHLEFMKMPPPYDLNRTLDPGLQGYLAHKKQPFTRTLQ